MAEEDYELLPHREIQRLKEEISKLKGGEAVGTDKDLRRAVMNLSEKIDSMNEILEAASVDLREEDKEAEIIKDKIDPIMEKMAELADQNQKIAKGLVAIHDLVDEKLEELSTVVGELRAMAADIRDMKTGIRRIRAPEMPRPAPITPPGLGLGVPPPPAPEGPKRMELKPPKKRGLFG